MHKATYITINLLEEPAVLLRALVDENGSVLHLAVLLSHLNITVLIEIAT